MGGREVNWQGGGSSGIVLRSGARGKSAQMYPVPDVSPSRCIPSPITHNPARYYARTSIRQSCLRE